MEISYILVLQINYIRSRAHKVNNESCIYKIWAKKHDSAALAHGQFKS